VLSIPYENRSPDVVPAVADASGVDADDPATAS
jgi:hypothetical protein